MDKVIKSFSVISKALDLDAGIFEAMVSTEAVDRAGDIVRAAGAVLENYLKNPVVMWAHNYYEPPVAKALSIEIIPGVGLKSVFQFPEWGMNSQADTVRRLWAAGFLNATSIGFIPLVSKSLSNDSWGPQEYTSWELLEYSIVPIPANQEALRLAMKNIDAEIKRGRVLSAGNERKLKDASQAIQEVLDQLGEEEPEKQMNTELSGDEPVTPAVESSIITDPSNDENDKAVAEAITKFLTTLFEVKK